MHASVVQVWVCAPWQVGVDLTLRADAAAVAAKSQALGALFQRVMAAECACFGFRLASPEDPEARGSQICYAHPEGYAIVQVTCHYRTASCLTGAPCCMLQCWICPVNRSHAAV